MDAVALAFRIGEVGSAEAAMIRRIFRRIEQRPETGFSALSALVPYAQIRLLYRAEMRPEAATLRPPVPSRRASAPVGASAL